MIDASDTEPCGPPEHIIEHAFVRAVDATERIVVLELPKDALLPEIDYEVELRWPVDHIIPWEGPVPPPTEPAAIVHHEGPVYPNGEEDQ